MEGPKGKPRQLWLRRDVIAKAVKVHGSWAGIQKKKQESKERWDGIMQARGARRGQCRGSSRGRRPSDAGGGQLPPCCACLLASACLPACLLQLTLPALPPPCAAAARRR